MNRIGVMADAFGAGAIRGIDLSREAGAGAVQLRVDPDAPRWTDGFCREVRERLAGNGLALSATFGSLPRSPDGAPLPGDGARRMFDLAANLGCDILTAHFAPVPASALDARYARLLDAARRFEALCREAGCRLAVETGSESPETLRGFLDELQSPFVGVNYDPANLVMVMGADPVAGVRALAGRILHAHAKDGRMLRYVGPEAVYSARGCETKPEECYLETELGEGDVDVAAWVNAMNETGYAGYITVERRVGANPMEDIRRAVAALSRLGLSC